MSGHAHARVRRWVGSLLGLVVVLAGVSIVASPAATSAPPPDDGSYTAIVPWRDEINRLPSEFLGGPIGTVTVSDTSPEIGDIVRVSARLTTSPTPGSCLNVNGVWERWGYGQRIDVGGGGKPVATSGGASYSPVTSVSPTWVTTGSVNVFPYLFDTSALSGGVWADFRVTSAMRNVSVSFRDARASAAVPPTGDRCSPYTINGTGQVSVAVTPRGQDATFAVGAVLPAEPGRRSFKPAVTSGLHEWSFGDGATSNSFLPDHVYDKPGDFTVTHCRPATDVFGRTCASQKVTIEAPELGVAVDIVDDEGVPIAVDAPPSVGDTIHVRVRVSAAADGVGALSGLRPVTEWLKANGPVERVGAPVLPEGPFDLKPGERRDVMFDYRVTQAGPIGFGSAVQGTDAIGRLVQADGGTRDTVAGIGVEVTTSWPTPPPKEGVVPPPAEFQADNNGDGKVNDADHVLTVTVKATNLLDVPLKDVHAKDPDEAVDFVNDLPGGGAAAIEPLAGATYDTKYGDLGPGKSATKTYRYQATQKVDADAGVSLRGTTADDRVVPGFGTADAKLGSHLALQVRMDMENRPYTSGQVVRLRGSLTNLLEDKTLPSGVVEKAKPLAVMVTPITEDNAGNGYVTAAVGGRTPLSSEPVLVAPGATIDIGAILATQRAEISSHAKVHYLVRAWEVPDDPTTSRGTEIDQSRVQFDEDETSSAAHDTILAPDPLDPDRLEECETTQALGIVSCNLWVGLRDFGYGTLDLGKLVGTGIGVEIDAVRRLAPWAAYQMATTIKAIAGDPQARAALEAELEVQYQTWVVQGILPPEAIDQVGDAFTSWLNEAQDVAANGDTDAMLAYAARAVGSNPDLALGPITKLRMMNSVRLAAVVDAKTAVTYAREVEVMADANKAAAAAQQDGILERVRASAAKGENVAEAGVFRGNEDVTDLVEVTEGVLGARAADLDPMKKLAKSENILIAVRSRGKKAAELMEAGLAYLKPMDVKAKSVNGIDVKYLGYRDSSLGKVELVSPPIDFTLAKAGRKAEFDAALDAYVDRLKQAHPELAADTALAGEVRARLELRTKEFPKELANFARYGRDGVLIEFGYGEQGLSRSLDVGASELRAAKVTPGLLTDAFGETRSYFELKMAGPKGGPLKHIAGDLDIVGILNDDRTMITDPAKRLRIYQALQELIGMQHGDTITWVNAEGQAKLLADHIPNPDGTTKGVDTLFVVGSDERVRTGFLEKKYSSRVDDVLGTNRPTFQLVTGAPARLLSLGGETKAVLAGYDATWRTLQRASVLLLPGKIDQFVDGLSPEQVSTFFDRGAAAVRPTGDGGIATYGAGTGGTTAPRPAASATSQAAAQRAGSDVSTYRAAPPPATEVPEIQAVLDQAAAAGLDLDQPVTTTGGPGAAGGSWRPVSLDSLLAAGSGMLRTAPITSVRTPTASGATSAPETSLTELAMSPDSPWFRPGDTVVVDPGGPTEERAVLTGVSPFRFASPLRSDHAAGTTIVLVATPAATGPTATGSTTSGPTATLASRSLSTITARARGTARGRVVLTVSVASVRTPAGVVRVMLGRKRIATGVLRGDTVVLRSKKLPPGRKVLRLSYLGSLEVGPSTRTIRVRVPRTTPR